MTTVGSHKDLCCSRSGTTRRHPSTRALATRRPRPGPYYACRYTEASMYTSCVHQRVNAFSNECRAPCALCGRQTKLCMPVTTACLPHGQNAPRCQMIVYIVALPAVQLMRTVLSPVSMQRSLPCAAESFFVSAWSHSALHGRFPSHTPHPPLEVSRFRESETHPTTLPIALQATPPPRAATRRTPPRCQPSACGWRGAVARPRRRPASPRPAPSFIFASF